MKNSGFRTSSEEYQRAIVYSENRANARKFGMGYWENVANSSCVNITTIRDIFTNDAYKIARNNRNIKIV